MSDAVTRARRSSGFSLLEVVVVLAITVTVLTTALPILYALLKEQRGLGAEILRGDTFPFVHARMDRDITAARAFDVATDPDTHVVSVFFTPRDEAAPTIAWDFSGSSLARREIPPDGSPGPKPHSWSVPGSLVLLPDEIAAGRLGLYWQPAGGTAEVLVFEGPRADEALK